MKCFIRISSCFLLSLCLLIPAGAVQADSIKAKVRTVNGQKEVVYTNEANDAYLNSIRNRGGSTVIENSYPVSRGSRRTRRVGRRDADGGNYPKAAPLNSKKKIGGSPTTKVDGAAVAKSSSHAASVRANSSSKRKLKKEASINRRPDGTFEFAPPQYEEVYKFPPSRPAYNDNWAFATFNADKRQPNWVSYYGWDPNNPKQKSREWVQVDINPIILRNAKIWGVDPLLIEILIRHESNFNPTAVSPVGAQGLMQLMPDTASSLGISDAFDVEQNIAAGTRYVASQLERFNSVPLALAAYNAGPGAVLEYGGVPPYAETQYYVDTIYGEYLAGKRARERR